MDDSTPRGQRQPRSPGERLSLPLAGDPGGAVTAVVHRPARARGAGVLLTHGAGGDLDASGLVALAEGLAERGHVVVRANLPYREGGRRAPPAAERSVAPYRALFEAARERFGPRRPWVAGGKSYGGRVASLAAADGMDAAGLVFYGYPLHPPGKPERLRVDHWPRLRVPCLFLQGTADPLCDLKLLDANLGKLARRATVHVVDGGDHSLKVPGKASPTGKPRPPEEVLSELAGPVADWLATL